MANAVGYDGLEGSPSLQSICDLYRSVINDNFDGGVGQINTNAAPWMLPFLNSAIRDLYSDLRMVSDLSVIRDNVIVAGLPPLAAGNPTVQVALTYWGFFNGQTWSDAWALPSDLRAVIKVWQRPSGTQSVFLPMQAAASGLPGAFQGQCMGGYELRGMNELWMTGAMLATDLRLRYSAIFPDFAGTSLDFANTYVPIQDSTNAIAFKMVALYDQRFSPDQFALAEAQASKFTKKLVSESVRNSQIAEYARIPFGANAC